MADDTTPDVQARAVEVLAARLCDVADGKPCNDCNRDAQDHAAALAEAGLLRTPGGPWLDGEAALQAARDAYRVAANPQQNGGDVLRAINRVIAALRPIPAEDRKDTTP